MGSNTMNELRHALEVVGKVVFDAETLSFCEGVSLGRVTTAEALREMQHAWAMLQELLPEVYRLYEDYRKLRHIARKAAVAILTEPETSSQLMVSEDWWHVLG